MAVASRSPQTSRRKRPVSPDADSNERKKKRRTSSACSHRESLFTDLFFLDMAATIGRNFPFEAFAKAHECTPADVFSALSAVALSPLQEPQPWHGAQTVADYAQTLMDWRDIQSGTLEGTPEKPIRISDSSGGSTPATSDRSSSWESISTDGSVTPNVSHDAADPSGTSPMPSTPSDDTAEKPPSTIDQFSPEWISTSPPGSSGQVSPASSETAVRAPKKSQGTDWSCSEFRLNSLLTPRLLDGSPIPPISTKLVNKNWANMKFPPRSEFPSRDRLEVLVDIYGSLIPVDQWIDGYHMPPFSEVQEGAVEDWEFHEMLKNGCFN